MTCRQLYLEARRRLSQAGIDSPGVDAALLSQRFLGLDRPGLALHGEEEPAPEQAAAFLQAVEERAARRSFWACPSRWGRASSAPGRTPPCWWNLWPRAYRASPPPRAWTCAPAQGRWPWGCSPSCREPLSSVWSSRTRPSPTWRKTSAATGEDRSPPGKGTSSPRRWQGSSPPAQLWAPLVKPGGLVAVEIGETQGPAVAELFQQRGLVDVEILQDWAGLDRVVRGKQP